MAIDGFIFDLGDVIYDASPWRRWAHREFRRLGVPITYSQFIARWEALLVDVYVGKASYWERFESLLTGVGIEGKTQVDLKLAAKAHGKAVLQGRVPLSGVTETLSVLVSRGKRIAALSDTEQDEQSVRKALRGLGVDSFFDTVVTSRDTGVVKPSATAYRSACESIGLDVGRCGFVGHDCDELQGATSVGLCSIAFNYDPDCTADYFIDCFEEILLI